MKEVKGLTVVIMLGKNHCISAIAGANMRRTGLNLAR